MGQPQRPRPQGLGTEPGGGIYPRPHRQQAPPLHDPAGAERPPGHQQHHRGRGGHLPAGGHWGLWHPHRRASGAGRDLHLLRGARPDGGQEL